MILPCAAAFIALVLIVLVCIFAGNANRMQNEYAMARNSIGEDLYPNLYMFARSYDGVTLAGADVEGSHPALHARLLPGGSRHWTTPSSPPMANAICFWTQPRATRLPTAFEAFDDAFAQGRSTGDAVSSMSACVQDVDQLLNTRYDAETRLLPA